MKGFFRIQGWKLRRFAQWIASFHVPLYAANATFYMILSLLPTVMLIVCLVPLIGYTGEDLLELSRGLVPDVLTPLLERIIRDLSANSSGILLSVSAVFAIWSSSSGVYCIQLGLNAIYGLRENRSYLRRRLVCMMYMLLLIAALVLTLVIHGFGRDIAAFCANHEIPVLRFLGNVVQFRGLILFVLLTFLFTAMFCVFPNRKLKPTAALPGAAVAATGWLLFTQIYSVYAKNISNKSVLYGSLSIVTFGMLWLFVCISILFYGSVVNLLIERRKK